MIKRKKRLDVCRITRSDYPGNPKCIIIQTNEYGEHGVMFFNTRTLSWLNDSELQFIEEKDEIYLKEIKAHLHNPYAVKILEIERVDSDDQMKGWYVKANKEVPIGQTLITPESGQDLICTAKGKIQPLLNEPYQNESNLLGRILPFGQQYYIENQL